MIRAEKAKAFFITTEHTEYTEEILPLLAFSVWSVYSVVKSNEPMG
jgi:hypothetical protein